MKNKALNLTLLEKICSTPGAPGFEAPIRQLVAQQLQGLVDEISTDGMGNLVAFKKGKSRKRLLISAHLDELGFMVKHIDDQGFVRFSTLGGYDPKTLSSQRVVIHGTQDVMGVMGTKPVHKMSEEERVQAPETKDFFIDTGFKPDSLKKLISVGDSITRQGPLAVMGDCVCAKSLDNRAGVFVLIEALKALKGKMLPWDLYAVFTVQEEVGLRGAKVVAHALKPAVCIGLDTTVAYDTPGAPAEEAGTRLGAGVGFKALDSGSIADRRLLDFLVTQAKFYQIKHQVSVVMGGSNDTAALQAMVPGGTIAGSIAIPTRHIHQSVEMCDQGDLVETIKMVGVVAQGMEDLVMTL